MNSASENMMKRRLTLADGRYLILYSFAPTAGSDPSQSEDWEEAGEGDREES